MSGARNIFFEFTGPTPDVHGQHVYGRVVVLLRSCDITKSDVVVRR